MGRTKDYEIQKAIWRKGSAKYKEKNKEILKKLQPIYMKNFLEEKGFSNVYEYFLAKHKDPKFKPTKKQLVRIKQMAKVAFECGGLDRAVLKERYNLTTPKVRYLMYTKAYEEELARLRNIEYMKCLVELLIEVRRNFHEQCSRYKKS